MSYQHFLEPLIDGHMEKKLASVQEAMYPLTRIEEAIKSDSNTFFDK
jgi:ribosomal protein S3AE